jgi:hypothetical protein
MRFETFILSRSFLFCRTVEHDSDDLEIARSYLAEAGFDPAQIETELAELNAEAEWLIGTRWGQRRVRLLATGLLRYGTITGQTIRRAEQRDTVAVDLSRGDSAEACQRWQPSSLASTAESGIRNRD